MQYLRKWIEIVISKTTKVKKNINKKEIMRSYIGLVTKNGPSFNLLDSQNMKNILKPICNALTTDDKKMFSLNGQIY